VVRVSRGGYGDVRFIIPTHPLYYLILADGDSEWNNEMDSISSTEIAMRCTSSQVCCVLSLCALHMLSLGIGPSNKSALDAVTRGTRVCSDPTRVMYIFVTSLYNPEIYFCHARL